MSMIAMRTGAPDGRDRVVLPDGREMTANRAKGLGYAVESLNEHTERDMAARSKRRAAIQRAADEYDGIAPPTPQTKGEALVAYAEQIEALPEAKCRPAAASEIWAKHTAQTMPVERAAAFLRGLPVEAAPVAKTVASSTLTAQDNAMFKRKLEIRILGLNMKADRGNNPAARNEATKLGWAMRTRETTGCSFAEAFTGAGLDARATITSILGH